jgi:hypothetical protein
VLAQAGSAVLKRWNNSLSQVISDAQPRASSIDSVGARVQRRRGRMTDDGHDLYDGGAGTAWKRRDATAGKSDAHTEKNDQSHEVQARNR